MDQEVICMKEYKAAGSGREGYRGGPGSGDMTRIGRLGRMIRLGRIAGIIRGLKSGITRRRAGQKLPSARDDGEGKKRFLSKPTVVMAVISAMAGLGASIGALVAGKFDQALALAALFIAPAVVLLLMLWRTRKEVHSLDKTLNGITSLIKSESELTRSAIKSESELTRKVLGGIAETLKRMDKTLERMDGKLDRIPGLSEPDRPDP
ncbi:hypothetical protein CENSYa_0746 [Cenarchaeum symbiosum A]|uniref:Uncharacterized protein n=1 Tax=Cenarchaeum symbiosum (strain A) TaxID=414004 RepID=A0RVL2_CENSY|nr:hypothetical protein CENSYa_0746 [Cenarchaeum symbiosum A]